MLSGDFPWQLVLPYLSANKTICRGILGSVVATQGSGPYSEEEFDEFLIDCGIRLAVSFAHRSLAVGRSGIAITQTIHDGPGKTYSQRRIAEGDSRQRALRCLKRRLARIIYNRLRQHQAPHSSDAFITR